MKHLITLIAFYGFGYSLFAQDNFTPYELTGKQAEEMLAGAEHIWIKQQNTVPAFISFRPGAEPAESDFLSYLKSKYRLSDSYQFTLLTTDKDQLGWEHKRYQLTVSGIPVRNGIFLLHETGNKVRKYNGYLFTSVNVSANSSLPESAALASALQSVGASVYKWQMPEEENFIKQETGDMNATFYPAGQLEILQVGDNSSNDFRLAWKFDIYAHEPLSRQSVFVDAQTGEVLKTLARLHDANTVGTAVTVYRGSRSIVTDSYNGSYRLYETTRGSGIRTRNLQKGTTFGSAVEFTDADNIWNNVNANLDQYAGDAHWGAEMTYDFYQTMGRNSINNNGLLLNLYIHYSSNYVNAFWDGQRMVFGDGNSNYDPLTTLDITGHEISHGLDEYTANLDYSYESGALNESFSDIFGTAVEWFADSTQGNWLIGEDIGSPFRSMSNPNAYSDPDTYGGTYYYNGTADYGGVHTNSAVQNQWYYRLAQGGSGTNDIGNAFAITGVGRYKATHIAWRNMVNYLTSTSDYADARFYAIQSALDLYGACSPEVVATTKAWYAVGVGGDYVSGADAQFTANPTLGCTLPFTVTFTNQSSNASSFIWYFGDGTSSTATNPTHTYTTAGQFTVKLVAVGGGTCGSDSIVYTNLIDVNLSNPCIVTLPTAGSYATQTSCTGTVYDNGGASGNYTNNTNSTVTIAPLGAAQVRLHFTQFNMENTYDFVYVYDGPNTSSPVIGSFTGTTIPADLTSSGSTITIRQYTDPGLVASGFAIEWTCINPNAPPITNFKANITQTCTGDVSFSDLTVGGATSWLWNFGDGNTSTLQDPVHEYLANGTFTITLTATNSFGSNSLTKTAYVTVNKPAGPVVANQTACNPQAFTLYTGDTAPATWFDSTGQVVSNSNPFTTSVINSTTTFYVQDTLSQPSYQAGPVSNTAVSSLGRYFNSNSNWGLYFNVYKSSVLVSVRVYASGAGYRTVQYKDSVGGLIAEKRVYIPNGDNRITLDMDLEPGSSYLLKMKDTVNLYRNNAGASFPYSDPNGTITITGNNGNNIPGYYYFFYDWEVKEKDCISLRTPVTVSILPGLSVTPTVTDVTCPGGTNGVVSLNVSSGTPAYNYQWSNGAAGSSITNLSAGNYSVTTTDANQCSVTTSVFVAQPNSILPNLTLVDGSCNQSNGAISTNPGGGTPGYSYVWSTGGTNPGISNLGAGTYTVTITDSQQCSVTSSATVSVSAAMQLSSNVTAISCYGLTDGVISVSPVSSNGTVDYLWSNGLTSSIISNLAPGSYVVTATDADGCSVINQLSITEPDSLTIDGTYGNAYCGDTADISLTVIGGSGTYSYLWNTGATSSSLSGVLPGLYSVSVTDGNQCTAMQSISVLGSDAISASLATQNVSCYGLDDGQISVNVSSGTPPYVLQWSNGFNGGNAQSNVGAGNYLITVTDNAGCTFATSATITQPAQISILNTSLSPPGCFNSSDGSLDVFVTGGIASYTYSWSDGSTNQSLSNVTTGTYALTVTDMNSCTASAAMQLAGPDSILLSMSQTPSDIGQSNGVAWVNQVTNATTPYTYHWSNGRTGSVNTGLSPGIYTVTLSDANGCSQTAGVEVLENPSAVKDVTGNFDMKLYPNPAINEVILSVNLKDMDGYLTMKNVLGQLLLDRKITGNLTYIDISRVSAGVYFVEVVFGERKVIKQLVINR